MIPTIIAAIGFLISGLYFYKISWDQKHEMEKYAQEARDHFAASKQLEEFAKKSAEGIQKRTSDYNDIQIENMELRAKLEAKQKYYE